MNAKPKRRGFQFSLRTLFLVIVVGSVGFCGLAYKFRQVEHQRRAVATVLRIGGNVRYDYQEPSGKFDKKKEPPGPQVLRRMLGDDFFARVIIAELSGPTITDEMVPCLLDLPDVEVIRLFQTNITDVGLVRFKTLSRLRQILLYDARVTDDGCEELNKYLPNLIISRYPVDP